MKEGTHCRGVGWVRPVWGQRKCLLAAAGATGTARTKISHIRSSKYMINEKQNQWKELFHVTLSNFIQIFT